MNTPHTFEIAGDGKSITCFVCGRESFNASDVREYYCGSCHVSHEGLALLNGMHGIAARHAQHHGACVRLGTFGQYDLYVGLQAPLPPTLIARYGDSPGDYETWNPALCGRATVGLYGEHFAEALRRADKWAVPLREKRNGLT
jgi:ribosomal protein S27AE